MKKLLIVLDCEDYILEDLNKFDINEIELYPNTDTVYSYSWEAGFRLLEMPQKKNELSIENTIKKINGNETILLKEAIKLAKQKGYNECLCEILGG